MVSLTLAVLILNMRAQLQKKNYFANNGIYLE